MILLHGTVVMKERKITASSKNLFVKTQSASNFADKAFQKSIDIYFNILDDLDAIIFVVDIQSHKILYANKHAINHLGNFTGKTCWQFLQGEAPGPCSFCSTKHLLDSYGKPHGSLNYNIQNTVTCGWYDVHERPLKLPDERPVRIHLATDITDKKKIYEKLRKSEEKYRTIADYTYDWECWLNEERKFEYISPSCERITGYRAEEFFADPYLLEKIIHPDDKSNYTSHQEEAFLSPVYSHSEYRIINKEGKTRWISHYCQPVYSEDGSFLGRRVSNRDITEKKEAEIKTKLNELRLSILIDLYEKKELDTKSICDFVLESSLPITSSSIGFLGFINEDESVMSIHAWSKNVMQECAIHKKPLEFFVCDAGVWGEAVRQKQPVMINDFSLNSPHVKGTPKGHIAINRFLAVPLLFDNKVISMVAVGNKYDPYTDDDVIQLQLLLEGMWQILRRKEAEMEVVVESKKTKHFANAVAHDLKNPAISIYGLAQMLKNKYAKDLDERALKYCEQIMKSSEQISLLAEDINIYITTHDTESNFEVLELQKVWNTIQQEFLLQFEARNIRWVEPDIGIVQIIGNRIDMVRIFRNLVENAFKYGGTSLSGITMGYKSMKGNCGSMGEKI